MSASDRRPAIGDGAAVPDSAGDVARTLHELGVALDQRSAPGEDQCRAALSGSALTLDGADDERTSLIASLNIDAVIDTNATVGQRSLHDFLR